VGRRKRHHTVTRMLLEGFAERNQVVARTRGGRDYTQAITNATVVADFYSFDNEGRPDDAMEDWLAENVESAFHQLLPALRAGDQPTSTHRPSIARFVAVAALRTRTVRSYMEQIDQQTAGSAVLLKIAPELGWDLASMSQRTVRHLRALCQQAWNALPPRPDDAASRLRVVVRESHRLESALLRYVWSVATTEQPSFLIGDAPVTALSGREQGWGGVVPRGATVFLPLSPHALLLGEPHVFGHHFSADALVPTVNQLTAREAFDAVYRHPKMAWPTPTGLGSQPPQLPTPSFRVSRPEPGTPPTFPYVYPTIDEEATHKLLDHLGAVDIVE